MATKKNSFFDFIVHSPELLKAVELADRRVSIQAKSSTKLGAIFAQIFVLKDADGALRIKGDYISPEDTQQIQAILTKRARSGS